MCYMTLGDDVLSSDYVFLSLSTPLALPGISEAKSRSEWGSVNITVVYGLACTVPFSWARRGFARWPEYI